MRVGLVALILTGCGHTVLPPLEPTAAQHTRWRQDARARASALDACSFWRLAARLSLRGDRAQAVYWMRRAAHAGRPVCWM